MVRLQNTSIITEPNPQLRCEIAVVGSGPGGAITACLLAEAGRDVLLIEEGNYLPLKSCAPFSIAEMVQKYRNGGLTLAMGAPKVQYAEGHCVGGGSEVNSGLYYRTPSPILAQWRDEFNVAALTEADLLPHFEACERDVNVCLMPGQPPAASLKLHEGATRLGWESHEVPRWFKYEQMDAATTIPKGKRQSMTETFIPRFLQAGGRLLPQTRVNTIRQTGRQWQLKAQTQAQGRSRPLQIQAETLFVAGGAVQTPALLRRSGIRRNIGNALQLHPTLKVIAQFPEAINAAEMGVPVHQVKEFSPRYSFGCSISSRPYLALGINDHPQYLSEVAKHWQQMAIYYAMVTGAGRGTVRDVPGYRDPLVRYHLTNEDMDTLAESLKKLCELLFAAGATTLYPSVMQSQPLNRLADLAQWPERLSRQKSNLMTIHLFSSCPMGENLQRCATDSFGKVRGFSNLYIADASLLCTAPGVNPQGSIMAIARRNTLKFLGRL
ncbi:MAG: GMC family oxidoreductase [Cyanobacteria bacterium P01_G01_bin.54]